MGVSIFMRPGTVMRAKGQPENITPGWRSEAAKVLQEAFGACPCEINRDDAARLEWMARACSLYTHDDPNFWRVIANAVDIHDSVVVALEY